MPKVGMRMIKSSIAVFICFLIYMIRGKGMPFYSAIAAILCMQPYVSNSFTVAKNRTVGTIIGGVYGMIILMIEREFIPESSPTLQYLLISISIIPIIYSTLLINKKTASYISCVVFLSITVTHGADVVPYAFAIDRIIDTLIGIAVSLVVNTAHVPRVRNTKVLFVSNLDGTLLNLSGHISSYTKIKLNKLLEKKALITISTARTPATLITILKEVELKVPIIVMNGAALYNMKTKEYLYCKNIDYELCSKVIEIFKSRGLNCFIHSVINHILHIYYGEFTNKIESEFYESMKVLPLENYICGNIPLGQDVIYITAIDKYDVIKNLHKEILDLNSNKIGSIYYEYKESPGYYFIEVFSKEASQENAIVELKRIVGVEQIVAFGNDINDIPIMESADFGFAVGNAAQEVRVLAKRIIEKNDNDSVVKEIEKIFYSKKFCP